MEHVARNKRKYGKIDKGFALLFAVLTASVLLSIGASIFNLTLKELILSSSGRESQFAFYAADTGIECAYYWDIKGTDIFAVSNAARTPSPVDPTCISQLVTINNIIASNSTSATTEFTLNLPNPGGISAYCVTVQVTKNDPGTGIIETIIDSRGYNTCDTTDPTRVERGLRAKY